MKDYNETDRPEAPDSAPAKGYDRAALEATIKGAEPVDQTGFVACLNK